MPLETTRFDSADYLDSEEAIEAYLEDAIESDDAAVIAHALGAIARARGMSQVARDAGLSRESLYKALSEGGNPEFGTVLRVLRALGMQMKITRAKSR